jgi:hypothetical protein
MFGLDNKSLAIGLVVGWLVVPRIQMAIMSARGGVAKAATK